MVFQRVSTDDFSRLGEVKHGGSILSEYAEIGDFLIVDGELSEVLLDQVDPLEGEEDENGEGPWEVSIILRSRKLCSVPWDDIRAVRQAMSWVPSVVSSDQLKVMGFKEVHTS